VRAVRSSGCIARTTIEVFLPLILPRPGRAGRAALQYRRAPLPGPPVRVGEAALVVALDHDTVKMALTFL
jgi:hypothetical protein